MSGRGLPVELLQAYSLLLPTAVLASRFVVNGVRKHA